MLLLDSHLNVLPLSKQWQKLKSNLDGFNFRMKPAHANKREVSPVMNSSKWLVFYEKGNDVNGALPRSTMAVNSWARCKQVTVWLLLKELTTASSNCICTSCTVYIEIIGDLTWSLVVPHPFYRPTSKIIL